jgi:ATP-dependent DNA helicase HFM1/MER3
MDERYYSTQGMRQQDPRRYSVLQPQFVQPSRPVVPRERYRATQYDHSMYDAVEDDGYGQGAQLDSFGKRRLVNC